MNKESSMIWLNTFGNVNEARDYAGRIVVRSAYNTRNSGYGWNVDHVRPISDGGTNMACNKIACHILTNEQKGDLFPHWTANNKRFKAIRA